jgi:diaminopimelate decarboxylase
VDVVGPICESSDCFGRQRVLQELGEGEYVALMSAGAYGFCMASRYNARPLPAEVLVRGGNFELVTARESFEQMISGERIPAWLKQGS